MTTKKLKQEEKIERSVGQVEQNPVWKLISYFFQTYESYEIKFLAKISSIAGNDQRLTDHTHPIISNETCRKRGDNTSVSTFNTNRKHTCVLDQFL